MVGAFVVRVGASVGSPNAKDGHTGRAIAGKTHLALARSWSLERKENIFGAIQRQAFEGKKSGSASVASLDRIRRADTQSHPPTLSSDRGTIKRGTNVGAKVSDTHDVSNAFRCASRCLSDTALRLRSVLLRSFPCLTRSVTRWAS